MMDKSAETSVYNQLPSINSPAPLPVKAVELALSAQLSSLSLKQTSSLPVLTPSYYKNIYQIGYVPGQLSKVILDPAVKSATIQDPLYRDVVIEDPGQSITPPSYEARHIQKIRRWHMNRHKLKKLRKRMKIVYRRRKYEIRKRKARFQQAELEAIKKDGEQFDALEFVKERLQRAKRGGYVQDISKAPHEQPQVPWEDYQPIPARKIKTYERKVFSPIKKKLRKKMKA